MKRAPEPAAPDDGRFRPGATPEPDFEPEPEYRRRPRPVPVRRRRGGAWLAALRRGWRPGLGAAAALALLWGLYRLFFASAWFVLANSEQITVRCSGPDDAAALQAGVRAQFAGDLGRNIFFIPLDARRSGIEALPWVRQAAVLRLWPARIEVRVDERTPVAFARLGGGDATLDLVDASGVLLPPPRSGNFDFPVLAGLAGASSAAPDSAAWREKRRPQMEMYAAFSAAVAARSQAPGAAFSEFDLHSPGDVAARYLAAPGHTVLVHFGDRNFASRYDLFRQQIAAWQARYPRLAAVDLRFDGEAIVDPGVTPAPAAAKAAARSASRPAGGAKAAKKTPPARRGHP